MGRSEKNWIPFVAEDGRGRRRLLMTYTIEPHAVLTCNATSGACITTFNTTARALWHRRTNAGAARRLMAYHHVELSRIRGGTPCVLLLEQYVCIAHFHNDFSRYWHWFYAFRRTPPHTVTQVSYPFRFAQHFHDAPDRNNPKSENKDRVQFAAGLARTRSDGVPMSEPSGFGSSPSVSQPSSPSRPFAHSSRAEQTLSAHAGLDGREFYKEGAEAYLDRRQGTGDREEQREGYKDREVGTIKMLPDGGQLTITYGVGDCAALEVTVPVRDVLDMLAGTLIKLHL